MGKIDEVKQILKELGLPGKQQRQSLSSNFRSVGCHQGVWVEKMEERTEELSEKYWFVKGKIRRESRVEKNPIGLAGWKVGQVFARKA